MPEVKFDNVEIGRFPQHRGKGKGSSGGGDDMQERVKKLEEQVSSLMVDVAVIKSNYATRQDVEGVKSELHKAISAQTKWVVASLFVALGAGLTIAKIIF